MANVPSEFSWNRLLNAQGFSTTGTGTAAPFQAPSTLPTTQVQGAGGAALDYYVRFTLTDGTTVMVNGKNLFGLDGFSFADKQTLSIGGQSGGAGAGKATFDPLELKFSQLALDPVLLKMLASGAAFKEVDVLGYSRSQGAGEAGHLVEDYSFGLVGATLLATDDSGVTTLNLGYGSQEIQFYQQKTDGSFPSTPTSEKAWNTVTNTAIFSTNGTAASTPSAAPLTLNSSALIAPPSGGTLDYYVRFTLQNGTVLTLNNAQYFGLSGFSFDDKQTLSIGAQSGGVGAGKATFDPLQLTFGQQGLDPQLMAMLAAGTSFKEVDVIGYTNGGGQTPHQLVQQYSFGLVAADKLAIDDGGFTQLGLEYGSEDIKSYAQKADGSFPSSPSSEFSWNRLLNAQGFSTTGTGTAAPFQAPSTLPTTQVQGAGGAALDYYVRFTLADGTTVMVNGKNLFGLDGFSFADKQTLSIGGQSGGAGAGKATFDPLELKFSQLALDPVLLKMLASGAAFKEVDVLGYSRNQGGGEAGHLVEDYSFGLVGATLLATDDSGVTTLNLGYGSQEIQFYQQRADGSFPSTPTSEKAWNTVTNTAIFSTNGTAASTPSAAPLTLNSSALIAPPSGGTLDYYVRFTLQNGTVLTLNNAQYFGLSGFSFDDKQTLSIGAQSGGVGAGKATFDPLQLTFGQQGLDPQLMAMLAAGTSFKEVDVIGYTNGGGQTPHQLVQQYSFGLVAADKLAIDDGGFTQLGLEYGSEDIKSYAQKADGSFPSSPSSEFSWNRLLNAQGFSTTGTGTAAPFQAPSTLPTTQVQGAGGAALDYYVRFTLTDGTTVMVNGKNLFGLDGFSFADKQTLSIGGQSGGAGAGKATFDPLELKFSQLALDPVLLKMLASGAAFKEVDVLGYSRSQGAGEAGHLVEDYSFGLVGATQLATDDSGVTTLNLGYGSQEIQFYQQKTDGSFPSTPTSEKAWNTVTNTAIFSTNGTAASTPSAAPLTLNSSALIAPSSGGTLDYYVRFTLQNGTVLTLNNAQYFGLSGFSFDDKQTLSIGAQSGGVGAGKATFDPLQLTFGQQGLDPQLMAMLAAGTSFKEVDVIGYTNGGGQTPHQLVQEYSFGLVAADKLFVDDGGFTQLGLEYGSEDIHTFSVACYCRGTQILTRSGEINVEDLRIGDEVATKTGEYRPIKWIGKRSYSGRFATGQRHILPVCFKAGSLGDDVPKRDLWISPQHAMYLEDVLIEAKDLINGVSVIQAERIESVEYFHIELTSHDVIVAEGSLSESFIDDDSRGMFHNAHEYRKLYPEAEPFVVEYYAPRLSDGYEVEAARQQIALRAGLRPDDVQGEVGALRGHVDVVNQLRVAGWAQNVNHPEAPVCLDIYVGGRLVGQALANRYRRDLQDAGLGSGCHSFEWMLPAGLIVAQNEVEVRRSLDGGRLGFSSSVQTAGARASRFLRRA